MDGSNAGKARAGDDMETTRAEGRFRNPIEGVALGDPFVLRWRGQFYLYGTNDGPPLADGRVFPVYRSDDLLHWEPLGGALEPSEPGSDHWAPEVLAFGGRFWMVVSFGDVERRGHALWVAVADRPEGPFRLRKRISGEDERFSIDGSWLLDDDGRLYLFRCLDFVGESDPPSGTGIVVQPMRDPLTPSGPPTTVLRAHSPWQVFERNRVMPLYEGRTFAEWTTIEGPAPVKRNGRYYCGYSGGNYGRAYGTGEAVADHPLGPYRDLRGAEGPIFGTAPGLVEGPGHFSVVRPDLVHDWIVLHGRTPGEAVRRVWLCPASWGDEGVTIGALTDRPQPAPPLARDLSRFDGPGGSWPAGWTVIKGGDWRLDGDGLRQHDPGGEGSVWKDGIELEDTWVVETYVRLPEPEEKSAGGIVAASHGGQLRVEFGREGIGVTGADGCSVEKPWPNLGDERADPAAYRPIEIRARQGRAEVRADGVVIAAGVACPAGPARLGLVAAGVVAFDAVTVAN
ncbi:MAG TPA: glycoside hydrolase family 43 protein [Isosphaeraceae bacterium]